MVMAMKYIVRIFLCVSIIFIFNACSDRREQKYDKVYDTEMHGHYEDYYFTFEPDGSFDARDLLIRQNGRLIVLSGTYGINSNETELELYTLGNDVYRFIKSDSGWKYQKNKSSESKDALFKFDKNDIIEIFPQEDE